MRGARRPRERTVPPPQPQEPWPGETTTSSDARLHLATRTLPAPAERREVGRRPGSIRRRCRDRCPRSTSASQTRSKAAPPTLSRRPTPQADRVPDAQATPRFFVSGQDADPANRNSATPDRVTRARERTSAPSERRRPAPPAQARETAPSADRSGPHDRRRFAPDWRRYYDARSERTVLRTAKHQQISR